MVATGRPRSFSAVARKRLHGLLETAKRQAGGYMKAFVIATETIRDETIFATYREKVLPTIEQFGGKFLARGGNIRILEGEWPHRRLVIIEFPSRDAAAQWYNSVEYQKIISLRHNSSLGNLVIVDGME
jgi:uncharacterized protein (DUF1330 family)